jgi:DNA polymerase-1
MSIPGGKWVETEYEARQWAERYRTSYHQNDGALGIDSETTGIDKIRDTVMIWSLSDGATRICLDRNYLQLMKEQGILENPAIDLDFTNAKFDGHMFANSGIQLVNNGRWRCTLPQSWLYNENNQGRHGLKECITDHFGRRTPTFEETFGKIPTPKKGERKKTIGELIREALSNPENFIRAVDYASLDSYNTTTLRRHFDDLLSQIRIPWGTLKDYYYMIEVPFTKLLFKLERRGITTDKGYLMSKQGPMEARMLDIEREFNREAGREINLNSAVKDVPWFFFEHLQKNSIKNTKGGKSGIKRPSTDAEVLEEWAGTGDYWAQKLLEYRGISKIYGTYVEGLQHWLDSGCRIHTSLNQIGTVTGRLSSSEPNLQNIPRADEDDFRIREAFIPSENRILVVADYEQLEMRLMAHFSNDAKMIDAIHKGMDLHCYTTAEMEGIPYDEVLAAKKTKKEDLTERMHELLLKRQNNKATGFGIIYGIGGPKLARKLTRETKKLVTDPEGNALIRRWLGVFPSVEKHIDEVHERMRLLGYVQVITGRFRRFGDVRNMSRRDASAAERQGVNSEIQGTAAEIAKMAMLRCDSDAELHSLDAQMLLQVHDELIFDVPDDQEIRQRVKKRVKEIMEHPFPFELSVPLPASVGEGYTWADAK